MKDPWSREVINKASHPHCFGRRVGGTNIGEMMLDVKAMPMWCLWSTRDAERADRAQRGVLGSQTAFQEKEGPWQRKGRRGRRG